MIVLLFLIFLIIGFSYLYHALVFNNLIFTDILFSSLLGFASAIVVFILIFFLIILLMKLDKVPTRCYKYKIIQLYFSFVLYILRVKVKLYGKENIPKSTFVVYSNHKSMLDILILMVCYKKTLSAVSKRQVFNAPFIKHAMKSCAVVKIDRENDKEGVRELLKGIENVKKGLNYIIFPEGGIKTRETECILEQRPGAYKLATKPIAIISPVSIVGTSHIKGRRFLKKMRISVYIHKEITNDLYDSFNTIELSKRVGEVINEGITSKKVVNEFNDLFIKNEETV